MVASDWSGRSRNPLKLAGIRKFRAEEKDQEERIQHFQNKKDVKVWMKENKSWMTQMFDYYMTNYKTDNWQKTNVLPYRGFMRMCGQLNIFPILMNVEEVQLLYRSTTKNQRINEVLLKGIDFKEFQEAVLRIAVKRAQILNAVDEEFKNEIVSEVQFRKFLSDYEQEAEVEFPSVK